MGAAKTKDQLKFRVLRSAAQKSLGEKFDVKAFHRQVLQIGAVPMGVLVGHIHRWVASEQISR